MNFVLLTAEIQTGETSELPRRYLIRAKRKRLIAQALDRSMSVSKCRTAWNNSGFVCWEPRDLAPGRISDAGDGSQELIKLQPNFYTIANLEPLVNIRL